MSTKDYLERNRQWAAQQVKEDPEFFKRHLGGQKPRMLVVSCADSRVPIEQTLGCGPGELFVHRNVANVVGYNDANLMAVVQYSVQVLKVQEVLVCGHYACGGVEASCADEIRMDYVGDWLRNTAWAKRRVDEKLGGSAKAMPRADYLRQVVEENVRLQVQHLSELSVVRATWREEPNRPRLHGWVYDMANGLMTVVVDGEKEGRPARG